jgi:regulator of sirC expression with transglutaminase-like and TPR domain
MRPLLALGVLIVACGRAPDPRDTTPPTPLTDALLAVAQIWSDAEAPDSAWTRAELDRLARELRAGLAQHGSARAALIQTLFAREGFVREVDDADLRFVLLPEVLKLRRGSCVGLGTLVLALSERLGWQARGVMVPGHFFVRITEQGVRHNLELLRRGEELSDAWYAERWPIPGGAAREYARELSSSEVRGVVEFDVGNQRRREGRLLEAQHAFDLARQHFPDFAEAHASAGAIAQLLGQLERARSAYQAAEQANPNLPGVEHNLELLDAERKAAPSTQP